MKIWKKFKDSKNNTEEIVNEMKYTRKKIWRKVEKRQKKKIYIKRNQTKKEKTWKEKCQKKKEWMEIKKKETGQEKK